jgi:hypothetical protein
VGVVGWPGHHRRAGAGRPDVMFVELVGSGG